MGCIFTVLSLVLRQKLHALKRTSNHLSAKTFDKTFNVFNPFAEHRKVISDDVGLLILFLTFGLMWLLPLSAIRIIGSGFMLGVVTFLVCLNLLMLGDLLETCRLAKTFENAFHNVADLAPGDLDVFLFLKKVLSRLSIYYLVLAVVFFASSVAVPLIVNTLSVILAQFISLGFTFGYYVFLPYAPLFGVITFSVGIVTMMSAFGMVKNRIFDLASLGTSRSIENQFTKMKIFVTIMHHHPTLRVPQPEES
jgi:hypothetical protein